jgi:ParB family chromosome partitioning protein
MVKKEKAVSPEEKFLEDQLRTLLGTKVTINHGKKGGTVVIHYYSEEELNALIDRFKKL